MESQLRAILAELAAPPPSLSVLAQARQAIIEDRADAVGLARRSMAEAAATIHALTPPLWDLPEVEWEDRLLGALEESVPLATEFAWLAEVLASQRATAAVRACYQEFPRILDEYAAAPDTQRMHPQQFEVAKFLGHELFVTLFAMLVRDERWGMIGELLASPLYARRYHGGPSERIDLGDISIHSEVLRQRNERLRLQRISLHADLLHDRHGNGALAQVMPFDAFADADLFLFLRGQIAPTTAPRGIAWRPWSIVWLNHIPTFLAAATSVTYAEQLLPAFGVANVVLLRTRMEQRWAVVRGLWSSGFSVNPLDRFDFGSIGSEP